MVEVALERAEEPVLAERHEHHDGRGAGVELGVAARDAHGDGPRRLVGHAADRHVESALFDVEDEILLAPDRPDGTRVMLLGEALDDVDEWAGNSTRPRSRRGPPRGGPDAQLARR